MSIARREFLRSGFALAATAAAECGCSDLSLHLPPRPSGGWDDVPAILARVVPPEFPDRDFIVTDYGAVGDGEVDCYPAFAAAIAACNKAGGGRVVVPGPDKNYRLNGPIHLLSNVNLYLEAGSVVLFGSHAADYLPPVLIRYQGIRCYNYSPLIYAYQQTNIAVTGEGTIDGQAYDWAAWEKLANPDWAALLKMVANGVPVEQRVFGAGHHLRLTMFEPYECTNVLVQGVTFTGSPFWTLHPVFCTNVTIADVTVLPGESNDDGCDPDSCTDVLVEDCTFTTNDDNVSVKAGYGADAVGLSPCQNIVFQNCNLVRSDWGGITIGSQTGSIVQNVFVQNCRLGKCSYAYFLKSNSETGGAIKNVFIRSSTVSECAIFFRVLPNFDFASGPMPPLFININLEDMQCGKASIAAFLIDGDARNPIVYITLTDIAIAVAKAVQQVESAFFITSDNVTVDGHQVAVGGSL